MNNNTFIHKYLKSLINKNDVVVDMTLGNGNDADYLASLANKVYGFDISQLAIKRSKERLKDKDNVIIIKDNHLNFDKYINENIKLFIFNLGYLPNSTETTITKANNTLNAFIKAYTKLEMNGYIIITFYLGHLGGLDEYYLLTEYFNKQEIPIIQIYKENKKALEPITYIIKENC